MLIAHAPAGYLVTRILAHTVLRSTIHPDRSNHFYQLVMAVGIMSAALPDADFIYHLFIDSDKTPHHSYITHMPIFWMGIWCFAAGLGFWLKNKRMVALATVACCNAIGHCMLDTFTGVIYWFYPLSSAGVNAFAVANVHLWWVHNYIYHWTFLVEIAIVGTAMTVFLRVKETISDLKRLFRKHGRLRLITIRLGVCIFGITVITLVGAFRFTIDNRLVDKIRQFKQAVVRLVVS